MRIEKINNGYIAILKETEYEAIKRFYKLNKKIDLNVFTGNLATFIFKTVSKKTGVSELDIKSLSKERTKSTARQLCCYLLKKYIPNMSYREVGQKFMSNHRNVRMNHANVIYSKSAIENLIWSKDPYTEIIYDCEKIIEDFLVNKQKNSNLA